MSTDSKFYNPQYTSAFSSDYIETDVLAFRRRVAYSWFRFHKRQAIQALQNEKSAQLVGVKQYYNGCKQTAIRHALSYRDLCIEIDAAYGGGI